MNKFIEKEIYSQIKEDFMKEYWNCIKIADIKDVSGVGGSYSFQGEDNHEYFNVNMKDGNKHTLHYISKDKTRYGTIARKELKQIINERDNVPEIYYLYTNVYANINGQSIQVGYEVEDNLNEYKNFSLNKIEELRKEFKIGDKGNRSLVYIQVFEIINNKIISPIEQKWIDQLISLGYDVSKLEYTLKS
jgi:hypothetical protein